MVRMCGGLAPLVAGKGAVAVYSLRCHTDMPAAWRGWRGSWSAPCLCFCLQGPPSPCPSTRELPCACFSPNPFCVLATEPGSVSHLTAFTLTQQPHASATCGQCYLRPVLPAASATCYLLPAASATCGQCYLRPVLPAASATCGQCYLRPRAAVARLHWFRLWTDLAPVEPRQLRLRATGSEQGPPASPTAVWW